MSKTIEDTLTRFSPYQTHDGEDYMNGEQLQHFKEVLLQWRQDLLKGVEQTVQQMQTGALHFPDPNDRASQEEEFTLELRARDRERKLIRKIDESLKAVELGHYGFCEACGAEIGLARLSARPTATLCIDCKTLAEVREKQKT
ncbi:MAG: RNA polymerase-binding protein DksA [Pseudomonadota bacterium]|nr:RNA polymerase-binding protein DksA [Pseudomonadota bacterium]